jgi:hypothetical protein
VQDAERLYLLRKLRCIIRTRQCAHDERLFQFRLAPPPPLTQRALEALAALWLELRRLPEAWCLWGWGPDAVRPLSPSKLCEFMDYGLSEDDVIAEERALSCGESIPPVRELPEVTWLGDDEEELGGEGEKGDRLGRQVAVLRWVCEEASRDLFEDLIGFLDAPSSLEP